MISRFRKYFVLSFASFLLSVLTLSVTPATDFSGEKGSAFLGYAASAFFWIFLIFGLFSLFRARSLSSIVIKRLEKNNIPLKTTKNIGLLSFFSCKNAAISDIIMGSSAVALAAVIAFRVSSKWVNIITLVIFALAFICHCFYNGKLYYYFIKSKTLAMKKEEE